MKRRKYYKAIKKKKLGSNQNNWKIWADLPEEIVKVGECNISIYLSCKLLDFCM